MRQSRGTRPVKVQNHPDMNAGGLIAYRPATSVDWPAIRALLQSCDLPLDGAEDYLGSFLVATAADQIAGCVGIEQHGDAALLRSVAVTAAHRHRGLGAVLIARAIALAQCLGIRQLGLLTTTAENYFSRFGFTPIAREKLPEAIRNSVEFRSACPSSACAMQLDIAIATALIRNS